MWVASGDSNAKITQLHMNMMLKAVDYDPVAEALKMVA